MKNNLQINETERWWNSRGILKFDDQYQKDYSDKNVVLYQNSRMNKVYEFLNEKKFEGALFEVSLKNSKFNFIFDKFIKLFKLSWIFKNLTSVLVFKAKKLP